MVFFFRIFTKTCVCFPVAKENETGDILPKLSIELRHSANEYYKKLYKANAFPQVYGLYKYGFHFLSFKINL